jgi:hypothetical protein
VVVLGRLFVAGPEVLDSTVMCTMGRPCKFELEGYEMSSRNRVRLKRGVRSDFPGRNPCEVDSDALMPELLAGTSALWEDASIGTFDNTTYELGAIVVGPPGYYRICWAQDPANLEATNGTDPYQVPLGDLLLRGPYPMQLRCWMGQPCLTYLSGEGLEESNRLLVSPTPCGENATRLNDTGLHVGPLEGNNSLAGPVNMTKRLNSVRGVVYPNFTVDGAYGGNAGTADCVNSVYFWDGEYSNSKIKMYSLDRSSVIRYEVAGTSDWAPGNMCADGSCWTMECSSAHRYYSYDNAGLTYPPDTGWQPRASYALTNVTVAYVWPPEADMSWVYNPYALTPMPDGFVLGPQGSIFDFGRATMKPGDYYVCWVHSYHPGGAVVGTLSTLDENNFNNRGYSTLSQYATYDYELANGYSCELVGWTHTRQYAKGFIRSLTGSATATVTGLDPGATYIFRIYQYNEQPLGTPPSIYLDDNGLSVNGVSYGNTMTYNSSEPTAAGSAVATADGKIVFTFTKGTRNVHLSGIAIAPDVPPDPMSVFNVAVAQLNLTGPIVPQEFLCVFGFFCKIDVAGYQLESEDQLLILTEGGDCFAQTQNNTVMEIEGWNYNPTNNPSLIEQPHDPAILPTDATFPLGNAARNSLPGNFVVCWSARGNAGYVYLGTFAAKEAALVFPCAAGTPCTAVVSGILQDPLFPPRLFPYTRPEGGVGFNVEL